MSAIRILVVDDNALNVIVAKAALELGGFDVECAADAAEAMQKVCRFLPEVVLTDVHMPGMDGLALTGILKQTRSTAHIVVIACSAFAAPEEALDARNRGCDGYLTKPINVSTFASQVRAIMAEVKGNSGSRNAGEFTQATGSGTDESKLLRVRF